MLAPNCGSALIFIITILVIMAINKSKIKAGESRTGGDIKKDYGVDIARLRRAVSMGWVFEVATHVLGQPSLGQLLSRR